MSITNYRLFTFRDLVEHVVDVFAGQDAAPRTWRNARRAVDAAYAKLPTMRAWKYYERIVKIATVASQTTGTIVFDLTGGAYERMVTLTGATWPTAARYYGLLIGRDRYEIEDYKSSTILTLPEWSNPGADVASTTYTLYRDTFPLPDYFLQMGSLLDVSSGVRKLEQVPRDRAALLNHGLLTSGLPTHYSIGESPHYAGGLAVQFSPSPTTARAYDAVIRAKGRALKYEKEYAGTVTLSAGSTAVVGSSTEFEAGMAGAILRVSSDTSQLPTGPMGSIEASELDNLYAEQFVIKSVTDATHLTLETAAVSAYAATKYTISDRLDFEADSMLVYFQRLCEAQFARIEGREDRLERERAAEKEFFDAAASDNRSFAQNEGYCGPVRLGDLATSVSRD